MLFHNEYPFIYSFHFYCWLLLNLHAVYCERLCSLCAYHHDFIRVYSARNMPLFASTQWKKRIRSGTWKTSHRSNSMRSKRLSPNNKAIWMYTLYTVDTDSGNSLQAN